MSASGVVTTGLSNELIQWLDDYAKSHSISKRSVFEAALKLYRQKKKREAFKQGFKRAADDIEMIEFAEMGLEDYNDQLNQRGA